MFKLTNESMGEVLDNNQTFKSMKEMYDEIEEKALRRLKKSAKKEFDIAINEIDKEYSGLEQEELKVMYYLIKGTALFRTAQVLDDRYGEVDAYHVEAARLLERGYVPDKYDVINMLILLNLGKNLRNMGMYGHRSDYDRALDCFDEIQKKIEKRLEEMEGGKKLTHWESCIWMEATINIGRIHKYLYKMEEAKEDFWYVFKILLEKNVRNSVKANQEIEKDTLLKKDKDNVNENTDLVKNDNKKKKRIWNMPAFLGEYEDDYANYVKQVLVELETVYLKERYLEAAKNLCFATLKIDKNNMDTKNNIAVYLRKRNKEGDFEKAIRILKNQEVRGNRFALINVLKCRISLIGNLDVENVEEDKEIYELLGEYKENVTTYYPEGKIENSLKEKLEKQPDDLELKLLLGLYYKKKNRWDEALNIFQEIYAESPYIRKGTIGLKAYYNIVQEYMRKKQFYKAKEELEYIITECKRDFRDTPKRQIDFLAEMDYGWCLQNLGYYKEAEKIYTELIEFEKVKKDLDNRYETKKKNEARLKNNLGICCLYQGRHAEARQQFEEVLAIEKNNAVANSNLGQYYMCLAREWEKKGQRDNIRKELREAIKYFQKATYIGEDNIEVNSNLIIAQYMFWKNEDNGKQEYADDIKKKLRFMNNSFSMKACFAFANCIKMGKKEEEDILYRAFARIRLGKEEEAYSTFNYFQNESAIRRLSTKSRGKILARLFQIYEKVLEVKKICRYTEDKIVPVHYTSLKTLKILLNDKAGSRLRLWNTADMNDPVEGEAFLELLKEVSKDTQKMSEKLKMTDNCEQPGEKAQTESEEKTDDILAKYFKHLSNSTNGLVPSNGNVYITSFTKCEDFIPMWNAYAQDAEGCSIKFGEEFFDIKKETDMYTGVSSYSDKSYPLYEVLYLNSKPVEYDLKEGKNTSEKLEKVKIYLTEIWKLLTDFELYFYTELIECEKDKSLREEAIKVTRKVIADFLNEIRFLFKYNEYSYEKEVRLIKCSYEPKVDYVNFDIPRLYIEVDKDINKLKEVCLGKKISQGEVNKLVTWLYGREKVEKITISSIHYQ